jgi:hypothetical protein
VTDVAKVIRLYDGTGWTCDVPCTAEQWATYKRAARKERMKVADWLVKAIHIGCESLIRQEEMKATRDKALQNLVRHGEEYGLPY